MTKYWASRDIEVVRQDDLSLSYVVTDGDTGLPIDVTNWDVYFKAAASSGHSTDTIVVAPGSVTKSNSGTGTTDTFTIILTSTLTDVDYGRYIFDIAVDTGSEEKVLKRGTLTVYDRETAVT